MTNCEIESFNLKKKSTKKCYKFKKKKKFLSRPTEITRNNARLEFPSTNRGGNFADFEGSWSEV